MPRNTRRLVKVESETLALLEDLARLWNLDFDSAMKRAVEIAYDCFYRGH